MRMTERQREILAEEQATLVRALAGGAEVPEGFDAGRVTLAGEMLLNKRARSVAKIWPVLETELGAGFGELFAKFAAIHSIAPAGPQDDGCVFARWLEANDQLPQCSKIEVARYRARKGWPIRMTRLSQVNRLVIVLRLPFLGVHTLSIPVL